MSNIGVINVTIVKSATNILIVVGVMSVMRVKTVVYLAVLEITYVRYKFV